MKREKALNAGEIPDLYFDLVKRFPLRPIRTDDAHDAAIAIADSLSDRPDRTEAEIDYLAVLMKLIGDYEVEREPKEDVTAAAILRELLDGNGLTQARLAQETGVSESTISDILAGRRDVSKKARTAFADRFRVDPGLFA